MVQPVLRLRPGVAIEKGDPTYRQEDGSYTSHYLVDHSRNTTVARLTKRQAFALLGHGTLTDDEYEQLSASLKKNHLLQGQSPPSKTSGSVDQKMLFLSIPIPFKPDRLIGSMKWLGAALFNYYALSVLAVLSMCGIFLIARQFEYFRTYTSATFSIDYLLSNGLAFGTAFIIIRVLHELSHALACKKAGGFVERFVITFIAGAPLPSTKMNWMHKATRRQKMMVAGAGIYIELWIAAIAAIMWAITPDGADKALWHYLAVINPMLTLSANLVPLMKFDGYHLWSAATRNPQLYEMAIEQFRSSAHRLLGFSSVKVNTGLGYEPILAAYGAAIVFWKAVVLPGGLIAGIMMLFEQDRIAYLFVVLVAANFWIKPLIREKRKMKKFAPDPITLIPAVALVGLAIWAIVPMQHIVKVEGAVRHEQNSISALYDSAYSSIRPAGEVSVGDTVAKLLPISHETELAGIGYDNAGADYDTNEKAYLKKARKDTFTKQAAMLQSEAIELQPAAQSSGYWLPERRQTTYKAGTPLGSIIDVSGSKLDVYIPKHLTKENEVEVTYYASNGVTGRSIIQKANNLVVSNALPKFMLEKAGGPFDGNKPLHTVQLYSADIPAQAESQVSVLVKTQYSIAGKITNQLYNRIKML